MGMQHSCNDAMKQNSRYRLVRTAFFRKVGKVVYVRNVATGEDFVFSKEALPILNALRNGITNRTIVFREQKEFIHELCSLGIVSCEGDNGNQKSSSKQVAERMMSLEDCLSNKDDIVMNLQEECRQKHLLWSAGLELTYRCNERCRHCYLDIHEEQTSSCELSEKEWLKVVDQLARMGCMNVLVTGGEPTIHQAFLSICEHIIKRGMLCDVYTNGLDVSDALFDSLCKLPLNSISVSLYSGSSKFHDNVTGVPDSFKKTLANLLRFKSAGFDAYAKVPVFHKHLEDYFAAKKLGAKYGFRVLASTILVPGHSGKSRNPMMMNSSEYMEFLKRETAPNTSLESPELIEKHMEEPICQAGQSTLCVSPFGDVMPCNSFPAVCGNIRKTPLPEIWRTSEIFGQLRKLRRRDASSRCAICHDISYCTICPGASWNEAKGQIVPCSWSCEQTKVRANFNRKSKQTTKRRNDEIDD